MHLVFSHGKESGPWGSKIKALATEAENSGLTFESLNYTDLPDPDQRAQRLAEHIEKLDQSTLLVGSSMGGYVSLLNSVHSKVTATFLLAPALYMEGYSKQEYPTETPVEIVHGWSDEIIPWKHSLRYAETTTNNTPANLHLIPGDHRLKSSLDYIIPLFRQFLSLHS